MLRANIHAGVFGIADQNGPTLGQVEYLKCGTTADDLLKGGHKSVTQFEPQMGVDNPMRLSQHAARGISY
jgi:hypothetical protein